MLSEDRSKLTADSLTRWFKSFQNDDIIIDEDNLLCLTSNSNLQDIWQRIIQHCHPIDYVKKVKETIRINELKERYPDRWEQHKNAEIYQGQIEQKISIRLREIYSLRCEQSTNIFNELNHIETMINDEYIIISSLDKQLEIYRQIFIYLNDLSKIKQQLHFLIPINQIKNQELIQQLINNKTFLIEKFQEKIHFNDLCYYINQLIQQRINSLSKLEKIEYEQNSTIIEKYEQILTKTNLDFTKQFLHLSNIRMECLKLHERIENSKQDVLSRRSLNEQIQLTPILDAMINSKSNEVHLNFLKKKLQLEIEQTKKFDTKLITNIHQQINDKRYQINQIDKQLNNIIQQNPLEKLEKLELKIRDYIHIINDLPKSLHSLNLTHLSLSNDLHSTILTWKIEDFSRINLINNINENNFQSLIPITSRISSTPLTSLKQLLGIRTQDSNIFEPSLTNDITFKEDNQSWDINVTEDDIFSIKYPLISSIDWNILTCVDNQMEEAFKQCKQDFIQYEEFFQNLIKEINVLQYEYKEKPAFRT